MRISKERNVSVEELIRQAILDGKYELVERLQFLSYVMDEVIQIDKLIHKN